MPLSDASRLPRATYRLQLNAEFTFSDAAALIDDLTSLGISDWYVSPILLSTPGSTHGYDVNDYRTIDPELGGREGFDRLTDRLRARGQGVLLDFVPNHMGITGPFNTWWREVLESGRESPRARFFDIFWSPQPTDERERILAPVLGDHYGRVLKNGELRLEYAGGELSVAYGDLNFPLSARSYSVVLRPIADSPRAPGGIRDALRALVSDFSSLARPDAIRQRIQADARAEYLASLKHRLADLVDRHPDLERLLTSRLRRLNGRPGDPHSFDVLHGILERQHYRLARWQAGAHSTNYRRFFAIDSLAGLRMENPDVFAECHALVRDLIAERRITGLRIDHIDGLWDPLEYLQRLQALAAEPAAAPFYVVVEKILAAHERLPAEWPVHGTTGYEFITELAGLFVDAAAEPRFTHLYAEFTGSTESYDEVLYRKKLLLLDDLFANAVSTLARNLAALLQSDRDWRDFSQHELAVAIRGLMASLRVYRTYRRMHAPVGPDDEREIVETTEDAIRRHPLVDPQPFVFLRDLLLGAYTPGDASNRQPAFARWILTFQQYTGAVMAKAAEDTAFYTYNRFIALNEVGGEPARFGSDVDDFHRACLERRAQTPHSLLTTSTHDTKLSEDARARLYALADIPDEWEAWAAEWRALNAPHKPVIDGRPAPDPNEEYRLYQTLLAAWPLDAETPDDALRTRLADHVRKAANEAKENSRWLHPNEPWLSALGTFTSTLLADTADGGFIQSFRPRARRLAHLGAMVSLAQLVLKLTSPGVPDIYQGCEGWAFNLVDPDNRRPVDYPRLRELAQIARSHSPADLLRDWTTGAIKRRVTGDLLALRQALPDVFARGEYRPAAAAGPHAHRVAAFSRALGDDRVVVAVPRLTGRLACPPLGAIWEDTAVEIPGGGWRDVITGRHHPAGLVLRLSELFAELPLAVLRSA